MIRQTWKDSQALFCWICRRTTLTTLLKGLYTQLCSILVARMCWKHVVSLSTINMFHHFLFQIIPASRELTGILNPHAWKHLKIRCPETPPCTQTVNLTGNRLPNLHGRTFDGNVRRTLRNLYLAHNLLTSVPRFCHWGKLWYVFGCFSLCWSFREALAGLEDLSLLDLSHNMINKVDRSVLMMIS